MHNGIRRLFFAEPKECGGALARSGRVLHWGFAGLGSLLVGGAIIGAIATAYRAITVDVSKYPYPAPITGDSYSPFVGVILLALMLSIFGRGLRYIFSNE